MDQEKYQQMQVLDYQVKQLQKIIESIDVQLMEVNNTADALREFEKLSNDDEILFPLANGIFAKGKVTDTKLLKINIGSNVVVEKTVSDAILLMEHQSKDMTAYKNEVLAQLQNFIDKMSELQEQS